MSTSKISSSPPDGTKSTFTTLPYEILLQICNNLSRADLKNFRFINKEIGQVADKPLFTEVFIRRNTESYFRFRLVASHPRFSKYVKSVNYSLMTMTHMLSPSTPHPTLRVWQNEYIGNFADLVEDPKEVRRIRDQFLSKIPRGQLQCHYKHFCDHIRSEELVDLYDLENIELTEAFRSLPILESVGTYLQTVPSFFPLNLQQFSAIGQKTFVEPIYRSPYDLRGKYLAALLTAAFKAKSKFKTIKGGEDLSGIFMHKSNDSPQLLDEVLENIHTLDLSLPYLAGDMGQSLASVVAHASQLRTLKIDSLPENDEPSFSRELATLLAERSYWPSLQCLNLRGFKTSEQMIRSFLENHSSTLRSLELGNIYLTEGSEGVCSSDSSWTSIILSLRDSFALEHVRFLGGLEMADWKWRTTFPDFIHRLRNDEKDLPRFDQETLLRRIEYCIINKAPLPRSLDRKSRINVIQC